MTEYIERRDILVSEEIVTDQDLGETVVTETRYWDARAYGRLNPSQIGFDISRTGSTAEEALNNLTAAVEEQGWEIR